MTTAWEFEHSVICPVSRDFAWAFWTTVENWAAVDSSVESVTLDGQFIAGTKGVTKSPGMEPIAWHILEADGGHRAVIEVPAPGAALRCLWMFEDATSGGTRITERASLIGENAGEYVEMFGRELEKGIPQVMRNLSEVMQKAASDKL